MIKNIQIANYKSIDTLEFELGRINVLIGENGAGKSNILEAIALAGAAAANKLDNEFLISRGIRVTEEPEYMRPAFPGFEPTLEIFMSLTSILGEIFSFRLNNDNKTYSKWNLQFSKGNIKTSIKNYMNSVTSTLNNIDKSELVYDDKIKNKLTTDNKLIQIIYQMLDSKRGSEELSRKLESEINITFDQNSNTANSILVNTLLNQNKNLKLQFSGKIDSFVIYSPENSALRTFQRGGQIEPLGINGEGLLKLLFVLSRAEYSDSLNEIKQSLQILDWFEDLTLTDTGPFAGSRMEIKDRYLDETRRYFDQLSTNEGFLFLLFYFALFSTDLTPTFFAIDNIDASLNPKLCEKLMRELVALAEKHDKQVIFTTHNPAILDGLNLDDDEQRLFVVSRNKNGSTRLKRVNKPVKPSGERPTRLSELFLRGVLGGLPKGF